MPRTTEDRIRAIAKIKAGIDLKEQIDAAEELVTELCLESGYSDKRLGMITTYLAAHFAVISYPRPHVQGAGSSSGTVTSTNEPLKVDLGLDLTKYGQQAKRLDTDGNLAELDEKMKRGGGKPDVAWLGTTRTDTWW